MQPQNTQSPQPQQTSNGAGTPVQQNPAQSPVADAQKGSALWLLIVDSSLLALFIINFLVIRNPNVVDIVLLGAIIFGLLTQRARKQEKEYSKEAFNVVSVLAGLLILVAILGVFISRAG